MSDISEVGEWTAIMCDPNTMAVIGCRYEVGNGEEEMTCGDCAAGGRPDCCKYQTGAPVAAITATPAQE